MTIREVDGQQEIAAVALLRAAVFYQASPLLCLCLEDGNPKVLEG